jgi:Immunoglobulin-like domain of bacterial spore germination
VAAAAIFAVAGLAAAFLLGRSSGSGGSSQTSSSTSRPSTGTSSSGTTTTAAPQPITATAAAFGGAPVTGGWRTRFALTFDHRPAGFSVSSSPSGFRVAFVGSVTVPPAVLSAVSERAAQYLMQPRWNPATRVLTVSTPFMGDLITSTAHGVAGTTLYLDDIRPPVRTVNGCLQVTDPPPYTGIYGVFTARGIESAFEGVFTMIVRGGGTQSRQIVHAAGGGPAPFSATLTPPLESQPVAGLLVAYELSPKDGQPTCILKIPVWLSPGG